MLAPITIRYPFRAVRRSLATAEVCDLFGVGEAEPPHVIADNLTLDIRPGDVVLFTGPSGSGKSSLMRAVGEQLNAVDAMSLTLPDVPLVDALPGSLEQRLGLLAACGLGEARLMLRSPAELSDGQRYRFRIAYAMSLVTSHPSFGKQGSGSALMTNDCSPMTVLCDEFAAVLDRTLAKVLAFNVRKLAHRTGVGVLCATTHDDLIPDLNPDVVVRCHGDGVIDVTREPAKKNGSASPTNSGCLTAPRPTGRTSLGGITARTTSGASAA